MPKLLLSIVVLILSFCILGNASLVFAKDPPPRPERKQTLKSMADELRSSKSSEEKLDKKMASLEKELEKTRGKMVGVSRSVQKNESKLQELEKELIEREREKDKLHAGLEEDRRSMARLILALQRIRRLPPEAVFARPGAPLETAQSAMLLGDIIPVLNNKAESLKKNLDRLKEVTEQIREDREEALKTSEKLRKEQNDLKSLMRERENLYASTQQDLKKAQARIRAISSKSRNLKDLMKRLDMERRSQEAKAEKAARAGKVVKASAVKSIPSPGSPQLPISGILKTRFGEPDAFGAPSQGIKITGRAGGLVVAPMAGTVRYTGEFKNYGNLVIIEHQNGYHSLVAGLEKIDTVVNRNVSAGEPIGALMRSSSGEKPRLYYELRLHGRPINPSRKFAELG